MKLLNTISHFHFASSAANFREHRMVFDGAEHDWESSWARAQAADDAEVGGDFSDTLVGRLFGLHEEVDKTALAKKDQGQKHNREQLARADYDTRNMPDGKNRAGGEHTLYGRINDVAEKREANAEWEVGQKRNEMLQALVTTMNPEQIQAAKLRGIEVNSDGSVIIPGDPIKGFEEIQVAEPGTMKLNNLRILGLPGAHGNQNADRATINPEGYLAARLSEAGIDSYGLALQVAEQLKGVDLRRAELTASGEGELILHRSTGRTDGKIDQFSDLFANWEGDSKALGITIPKGTNELNGQREVDVNSVVLDWLNTNMDVIHKFANAPEGITSNQMNYFGGEVKYKVSLDQYNFSELSVSPREVDNPTMRAEVEALFDSTNDPKKIAERAAWITVGKDPGARFDVFSTIMQVAEARLAIGQVNEEFVTDLIKHMNEFGDTKNVVRDQRGAELVNYAATHFKRFGVDSADAHTKLTEAGQASELSLSSLSRGPGGYYQYDGKPLSGDIYMAIGDSYHRGTVDQYAWLNADHATTIHVDGQGFLIGVAKNGCTENPFIMPLGTVIPGEVDGFNIPEWKPPYGVIPELGGDGDNSTPDKPGVGEPIGETGPDKPGVGGPIG